MSMVWLWFAAFAVVALAAPEALGDYWRNLRRVLRRR